MTNVIRALARALQDLRRPRVVAMLFVPMLGAIVLWALLAWFFWDAWSEFFRAILHETRAARWVAERGARWLVESVTLVMVIALLVPAVLITATAITGLALMPVLVSMVERDYQGLVRRAGGSFIGSLANTLIAVLAFLLLWLVTLPLWVTGIGGVLLPAINSAYLNQRLFRYDALASHASRDEYRLIIARARGRLYALGLVLALLYYVPLVNLVAPVITGLAYTHFCLLELAALRRAGSGASRS
jgi:CysZ protein